MIWFFVSLNNLRLSLSAELTKALIIFSFLCTSTWADTAYSPYFEAHLDDLIDWNYLTKDVVEQAEANEKLILLSSGYVSCYWCHSMKVDTFNDSTTADFINNNFVPILIDRDLEPETDAYLQDFMQQTRGIAGWPSTVVFTPSGQALIGFTYEKPDTFVPKLKKVLSLWQESLEGDESTTAVDSSMPAETMAATITATDIQTLLDNFLTQVQTAADEQFGGFGDTEKFPYVNQLSTLLEINKRVPNDASIRFIQTSLEAMLGSGLRDHIDAGFFRYSADRQWIYPHYEKMLYTQALMGQLLIKAGEYLQQPRYITVGLETLDFMVKVFKREDGLYNTALSAVGTDGQAGSYYLWSQDELEELLGPASNKVILNLLGENSEQILPFLLSRNEKIKQFLLHHRSKKDLPLDDKVLTAHNGLALTALSFASPYSTELSQAATDLAVAISRKTFTSNLRKSLTDFDAPSAGLEDFVYLAKGLCDWSAYWFDNEKARPDLTDSQIQQISQAQTLCVKLLHESSQKFFGRQGWLHRGNNPLLDNTYKWAKVDTQLPSATAIWLDIVWNMSQQQKLSSHPELLSQATIQLDESIQETTKNAFFHGRLIESILQNSTAVIAQLETQKLQERQ